MAWNRAAIETWQTILRYVISVPVFFETSPIDSCGLEDYLRYYNVESPYWQAERQRNALRRVCSSWDTYLKGFNNRYVQLYDVVQGNVPVSAITRAIRLQSRPYRGTYSAEKLLLEWTIEQEKGEWSTEILEVPDISLRKIILESGKVGNLKSIVYTELCGLQELSQFPLQHCDIYDLPVEQLPSSLHLSHLSSISVVVDAILPFIGHQFPILKYLSIFPAARGANFKPNDLLKLLRSIGRNLLIFFDKLSPSENIIPDETWALCPRIERFQTGLKWPTRFTVPLPLSLHRLHISADTIDVHDNAPQAYFPASDIYTAGIRIIVLPGSWGYLLSTFEGTIDLVLDAMVHGLIVEDICIEAFKASLPRLYCIARVATIASYVIGT